MKKVFIIIAGAFALVAPSACTPQEAARVVSNVIEDESPPVSYDLGEPLVAPTPDFATQTAPQAPGPEDDGRFGQEPAPQAPCDAPYPACGRP